jgi:hypothetical protein
MEDAQIINQLPKLETFVRIHANNKRNADTIHESFLWSRHELAIASTLS